MKSITTRDAPSPGVGHYSQDIVHNGLDRVLSMTVYIQGRELWPKVNQVYARVLGDHKPARAMIPVPEIKPGCLIEIQAIAAVNE